MITIYDVDETSFAKNGLGVIQLLSCVVKEELNGLYELNGSVLVGMKAYEYITNGNILKVPTPNGYQLFRIFESVKNIDGSIIEFKAKHIFYDLLKRNVNAISISNSNIQTIGNTILNNTDSPTQFTFSTDIEDIANLSINDVNGVNAFMNDESSILALTGGQILRDNFNIVVKSNIGADRGYSIRYAKNLTGLDYEDSIENLITRIKPVGLNYNDTPLYLPEVYIDSENINEYGVQTSSVKYSDLKVGSTLDDVTLTQSRVFELMRERVAKLLADGVDKPTISMKVNFILLTDTTKYQDYKVLEKVMLGDTVTIVHSKNDINVKTNVIAYEFNSLSNRYESIELGKAFVQLSNLVSQIGGSSNNAKLSLVAKSVLFDNENTSLSSTDVQSALIELLGRVETLEQSGNI